MRYLSAAATALRLGKHEKTIRRWIHAGRIAVVQPSEPHKHYRIAESEIVRLAQQYGSERVNMACVTPAQYNDILTRLGQVEQRVDALELTYGREES